MQRKIKFFLKWGCLALLAAVILIGLAAVAADRFIPSLARRSLPSSASDVQEYYSGLGPDYIRCLKAKLPESDVAIYAKNLDLTTRFDPVEHAKSASIINMGFDDTPTWWNPPSASASSYFNYTPGKEFVQVLRYSEGYVYYVSTAW